ncbi:MAG: MFS transporter [Candidatus Taylorbacteria bacterium]|nr:MFS transporter [Candidatus Taylorbacteria bacterium]
MKFIKRGHNHALYTICFLAFVFTLHSALPSFIGSSFLGEYTAEKTVGLIYSAGSVLTVLLFLCMSKILRKIGNYETTFILIILQAITLFILINVHNFWIVVSAFILNFTIINLIIFTLDIFLENHSDNVHTGGIRGLFLTTVNIGWILSPMLAGVLVGNNQYHQIFLVSFFLLIPFAYLLRVNFRHFKDPNYDHLSIKHSLHKMFSHKDFYRIASSNIILHFFYAWMTIYTPIYLHQYIGFNWEEIGIIFTIMLIPFVIFEIPLGKLADERFGEKELLSIGFIIAAIATCVMSFITIKNIWIWALILFITRIGASMIEVMNETYFFKKIDGTSSSILSLFRITRPVAYIIAPIVVWLTFRFVDYQHSYIVLAVVLLWGLRYSLTLRDTK